MIYHPAVDTGYNFPKNETLENFQYDCTKLQKEEKNGIKQQSEEQELCMHLICGH